MNMPIMEKFYLVMTEGENFKTAQSLKSMLDDLVDYRRDRIINTFRMDAAPFEKVWSYRNAAVFDTKHRGTSLALDVAVEPESYSFQFFDRNNGGGNDQAKATLQKMGCLSQYTCQDGRFTKPFAFPSQEADLYRHILDFKMKLAKVISND